MEKAIPKTNRLLSPIARIFNEHPILSLLFLSCVLGTLVYVLLFGVSTLYLTNTNWMYNRAGDSLQHQLGWLAFRSEPWSLQFGTIHSLSYPYGTSIVFTDSIPLLAIFFKLFSAILPLHFQYFGFWTLLCWILTIFFSVLIFREFHLSLSLQFLGGVLVSLTPTLIDRVYFHDALCAQWLILAAVYLTVRQIHGSYQPVKWVLLLILALMIHAYLFFMVGVFFVTNLMFEWIRNRKMGSVLFPFGIAVVSILALAWLLNLYGTPVELDKYAIDYYSFNLLSFINADHSSSLINTQPYALAGQYEGFAYLGLGNIILLLFIIPSLVSSGITWGSIPKYLPLILPAVLLSFLSVGNSLTFGKAFLITINFPDLIQKVYETFRSVGRFIWPLYYLIILCVILYAGKKLPKAPVLLILAILIQFIDLRPLVESKAYTGITGYENPLSATFWKTAPEYYQHIEIIPSENMKWKNYSDFAIYAVENHLTINWVYLARSNYDGLMKDINASKTSILSGGKVAKDTIYITDDADFIGEVSKAQTTSLAICQGKRFWYMVNLDDASSRQKDLLKDCAQDTLPPQ
jgi:hypothetical protein